ncbi:alkaline phosphatase [Alteribacillus sp. YIM 98480]|uniref:alkaline phosphatase n=1 Tax=Alteribacillus sp. YIM 98480 TaxID=2606599 RepID=UPI0021042618|nr:alkaline phosphatase [Alteribacillus sp. YIM 98480]
MAGQNIFLPEEMGGEQGETNLIEEAKSEGFEYIEDQEGLDAVDPTQHDKILGLFGEEGLTPEMERPDEEPSIAAMTETAIESLKENEDGFFLMVEGSQIDWAGHEHDAAWAMSDTEAFEWQCRKL